MMLNSLALRGRSLFTISSTSTLPTSLRPLASHAISSAHQILIIVLEEPNIRDSMVGVPLYLHTVIAFAVVFLIKMSSRWTSIGVTIDPETRTKPLIEGVIALFRGCRAGKSHILYSMADGFERLLRRNLANGNRLVGAIGVGLNGANQGQGLTDTAIKIQQDANGGSGFPQRPQSQNQVPTIQTSHSSTPDLYRHDTNATLLHHQAPSPTSYTHPNGTNYDPYAISPHSQPTSSGTYGGWQTEDDMLWSMSMGYDLLATAPDINAHGLNSFLGWNGPEGGGTGYGGL